MKKGSKNGLTTRGFWWVLIVGFILAIAVGIGVLLLLCLKFYTVYDDKTTNLLDLTKTAVTIMGALAVGGAAAIQLRKHLIAEHQNQREEDKGFREQLTKAIEHLGHDVLTVRIGALWELHRLAEDSPRDRPTVVWFMCDYIRRNMEAFAEKRTKKILKNQSVAGLPKRPDEGVFVASECLTKLQEKFGDEIKPEVKAQLRWAYLEGVNLDKIHLEGANFFDAHLEGADFREAHLEGADLRFTKNLTPQQPLAARINETTLLDPELREAYEKLKQEHPQP